MLGRRSGRVVVRDARPEDALAIARVHVRSWQVSAVPWLLAGNERGLRFYRRHGWEPNVPERPLAQPAVGAYFFPSTVLAP